MSTTSESSLAHDDHLNEQTNSDDQIITNSNSNTQQAKSEISSPSSSTSDRVNKNERASEAKNQGMIVPCEFVVYATLFFGLDFSRVIVGGGGGHGIPNKIMVMKFNYEENSDKALTVECDHCTEGEVVWNLKFEMVNNTPFVVFTSLDKLHLLKYDFKEKNFTALDSKPLFSSSEELGKKICDINSNGFVVANDDNNTLHVFHIENDQLECIFEMKNVTKKNMSDLTLANDENNTLGIVSEDKAIRILRMNKDRHYEEVFSSNIPNITQYPKQDVKHCLFPKNNNPNELLFYTLHTSRSSPTFVSNFKIENGIVTLKSTREFMKRPATAFSVLIGDDGKEYISFGVDGGIQLYKEGKHIGKKLNIHSEAITCIDICKDPYQKQKDTSLKKKKQHVHVCSGSIDRSISVQHLNANKKISTSILTYLLYILALVVLILAVIYIKLK
ncbi:hypothetical protein C9374_004591 [Naegleria lovaniensis]|uniref:Uncharacterized protein n=1 Tax=Naegleria lovaniensis TaxID=51637 RepID=A0AA88KIV6_NAELO|nr:uncharacterized protein C9374_004591 [Naegleria lovaniensis]KAG2383254.1 hypothetical protein C9374_004591 [Naegleria lovaniensis]